MTEEKKDRERAHKIFVNGREKEVVSDRLSFEEVVVLAFGQFIDNPDVRYTVIFHHADQQPRDGELLKGGSVRIKNNTSFDVTKTDRS